MPLSEDPLEESVYDRPVQGVTPFDPETVKNTRRPERPVDADSGPSATSDPGTPSPEPEQPPLPEFDPKYLDEFRGLMYVGALKDTFRWMGHTFVIRTLTTGELAEVALAAKPYAGSDALLKAYQSAVVAACVVSVDGQPLPMPITNDAADSGLTNAFNYVMAHWFPPTIDVIYERYYALEITVRNVLDAMGKVSG